MSCNITSIDIVHSNGFGVDLDALHDLAETIIERPDASVFDPQWATICCPGRTASYAHEISCVWWSGDWSGHTLGGLIEVLSVFDGEADLVLTWEGGDSHTGLRLRDHKVTRHEVVMALGDEVKS